MHVPISQSTHITSHHPPPTTLAQEPYFSQLMLSTYHGHAPLSRLLLSHGADPNRLNDRGQSPLAGAVFKDEKEIVDILLEAGANVDLGHPSAWETVELFKKTEEYGEKFSRQGEKLKSAKGGAGEGEPQAKGGIGGTKGAGQMI